MTLLTDTARAKVNLTLRVLGRRSDGYHDLDSLVAFADIGDLVTLDTAAPARVSVTGPFAPTIAAENLLDVTLRLLREAEPRLVLGLVRLDKRLPVAAGIGGGSADAAALLRLVRRANPGFEASVPWRAIAARLGADVPVCFENRASWMRGIGEQVVPLTAPLPALFVLMVNPRVAVPADKTAQVFRKLRVPPVAEGRAARHLPAPALASRTELIAVMRSCGNDLEAPALAVVPAIADVTRALAALPGAELVALSGGGPTCFAVFATREAAELAAATLEADHPSWWFAATALG